MAPPKSSPQPQGNTPITDQQAYEQASECCRIYSELTMRVRTLVQQVLITFVLGLGVVLTSSEAKPHVSAFFIGTGVVLALFASALHVLNQHYSQSFTRIRNQALQPLEERAQVWGPGAPTSGAPPGTPAGWPGTGPTSCCTSSRVS